MTERKNVKVQIYGKEHSLVSTAAPQATQEYAAYVDSVMRKIGKTAGSTDYTRVAMLALMQVTHELFALRKNSEKESAEAERRLDKLLAEINSHMESGGIQTEIAPGE